MADDDRGTARTYFPACRVRLHIRFDEFAAHDAPKPAKKPGTLKKGKGKDQDKNAASASGTKSLTVQSDNGKLVLAAPQSKGTGDASAVPQVLQGSSSDDRTFTVEGVIPRRCSVTHNGIRTASTASMEFAFDDLPFDPRLIRACGVEVLMGTVTPEEFAKGLRGETRLGSENSLLVVPDTYLDDNGNQRTNIRFQGWADQWEVEFPEDGDPFARIECTDCTRLLIDNPAPPKLTIDETLPIDRGIADYLSNFPQFVGLSVEIRPAGTTAPIPKAALAKTAYTAKLGPPAAGDGKENVWDYLTDVCGMLGFVVRMVGTTIVIQKPRTLYGSKFSGRDDDPFQGRTLPDGSKVLNRLYVYGDNIAHLGFKRKMTKFASKNVEVRSYSSKQKKTIVSRFPLEGDRQSSPMPGDQTDAKWDVIRLQGIEDQGTLDAVAQSAYESVGRNELECTLVTRDLGSKGGSNLDPDMLDAIAGDNVEVGIRRDKVGPTVLSVEDGAKNEAANFLVSRGYPLDMAVAYARAAQNVGFPTTFRIKKLSLEWSWDDDDGGIQVHAELQNYIEVRADVSLGATEPTGKPTSGTKASTSKVGGS